ncbi:MAG: dipeptidase E [Parcubacteria group bacterium Gr01-1014_20]|nr:MAG: dipeptidase E [Parcubacteria group bacterium Gr01-1014_20]
MGAKKNLLLISNSRAYGRDYLDHCAEAVSAFLAGINQVLFIPYALKDWDDYAEKARKRLNGLGVELVSIHEAADHPILAVSSADAIFVGGGNTFRLLEAVHAHGLTHLIRERVSSGMLYMGSSAGSNLACPTICTTNDMPIRHVSTFEALKLVPFQINPHFVDADPNSRHMGETRETRIKEFHEENVTPVIGLREGSWLRVEGDKVSLRGDGGAKIFLRGQEPFELGSGNEFSADLELLKQPEASQ